MSPDTENAFERLRCSRSNSNVSFYTSRVYGDNSFSKKKRAKTREAQKKARSAKNTQNKQHTKAKNKRLPQKPRSGVGARGTSPPQKKREAQKNKAQNQLKTTMFRPKSRVRARGTSPPQKTLKNRKKPPKWGLFELRIHIKRKITSRLRELRRFLS